ncbi:transporter substrate-binding domain-containing protein [Acidobacteriota bacterium]
MRASFRVRAVCMVVAGLAALAVEVRAAERLLVDVKAAPPFVIVNDKAGEVSGFSIDLMNAVAGTLKPEREITYHVSDGIAAHLEYVRAGRADAGIAATTVTALREQSIDFSHPIYQSSLDILVRAKGGFGAVWRKVLSRELVTILAALLIFVLVFSHLIWAIERGGPLFSKRWFPGVGQGIWWSFVTMSTVGYGDYVPRRPAGRFLAIIIIFAGIALFGMAVATITALMTVNQLRSDIRGPDDLLGRRVAVISGSTGERAMEQRGVVIWKADNLDQAVSALESKEVDAIVHDRPLLQYYLKRVGKVKLTLVGKGFNPSYYAVTFPPESPLREEFNHALLTLMEDDGALYSRLHHKWFGIE